MNRDIEILAEAQHEIWAHWMRYMFSQMDGNTISQEDMERWKRQANTKYADLSDDEKASDRHIVLHIMCPIVSAHKSEH